MLLPEVSSSIHPFWFRLTNRIRISFVAAPAVGTITLFSGLSSGLGINLTSNSRLLSLLPDENLPGGAITVSTLGGDIVANGLIEADGGSVTISNFV